VLPCGCGSLVLLGDGELPLELTKEERDGDGVLVGLRPPLDDLSLRVKESDFSLFLNLDRPIVSGGSISWSDPGALAGWLFGGESGVWGADGSDVSWTTIDSKSTPRR